MKVKHLIIFLLSLIFAPSYADDGRGAALMADDGYISVDLKGGVSTIRYDLGELGTRHPGGGGAIDVSFDRFVGPNWGFSIGLGVNLLNASADLNQTYTTIVDIPSDDIMYQSEYVTHFSGWREHQRTVAAELPLRALYRMPMADNLTLLFGAGLKLSLPIKTRYNVTDGTRTMTGRIDDINLDINPDMEHHGYYVSDVHPEATSITKKLALSLIVDANVAHNIGKVNLFYGLFGSFGLTNVADGSNSILTGYDGSYNGVIGSNAIDKARLLSFGVRVGVMIPCLRRSDADGDGVADYADLCPGTPQGAPVDRNGCPLDTDGDGVIDLYDRCSDTPEGVAVDTAGCPLDTDGDGVADYLDKCPATPSSVEVDADGCPLDTDGDGVADYLDKCPATPSSVEVDANGCPLDTDGDGVPDYKDKCPDVHGKGSADGCPEVSVAVKQVFQKALNGIQFQTGKSTILKSSNAILNQIVKIMKDNPDYRLKIYGHTDNDGKADANLKLSKQRAAAVAAYLVKKGVKASRLTSDGFGSTKPVASNKTAKGKAKNRRVEFIVEY